MPPDPPAYFCFERWEIERSAVTMYAERLRDANGYAGEVPHKIIVV